MYAEKICRVCGKKFVPKSARQLDCNEVVIKNCEICGKEFETRCSKNVFKHTCSPECQKVYVKKQQVKGLSTSKRICKLCGKEFVPHHGSQLYCDDLHTRTCVICGKEFPIELHTGARIGDLPVTCSKECANKLRFKNGNPFADPESREKARITYMTRTGYSHPMHNPEVLSAIQGTYQQRTGYSHPSHNPEARRKSIAHSKVSSLECRVARLFDEYNIEYSQHHMISTEVASHEFDFFLPRNKMLIDCDGVYFHSYLDDPDGKHVLDYYDEDRLSLIPEGFRFHVIVEGQEDKDIKDLVSILKSDDPNMLSYDTELFKWCRSVGFPYPNYPESRLHKTFESLKHYTDIDKYNPTSRIGDCIIKQFHKSLWDSKVKGYPSVREAWEDDTLLKKVISNRLIYKNNVDPSKVLTGFNISKICPRVSIFNPVLAKYIVSNYLSEFDTVFDPFSGFSGRLLGVVGSGRKYIGRDNNAKAVKESNEIISFLSISDMAQVSEKNIFSSTNEDYSCLFTCPPYGKKESYSNEDIFLSCDEWITFILNHFNCRRYVFVVDDTEKYEDNVVECIKSTSHFVSIKEKIIVIHNEN